MSNPILFPHQQSLIKKCLELEKGNVFLQAYETINTRIGIIGEKSGAGKSYVMLELACLPIPKKELSRQVVQDLISIKLNHDSDFYGPSIIVVHHSLIHQWKIYADSRNCCFLTRKTDLECVRDIKEYDIVILSSSIYNRFCITYNTTFFKRVFVDEADTLQLVTSSGVVIHSVFYWFVTSSFNNLLKPYGNEYGNGGIKHGGFIKDLFTYLYSIKFDTSSIVIKNADSYVDESINLLPLISTVVKCRHNFTIGYSKENIISKCYGENSSSSLENLTLRIESNDCPICFEKMTDKAVLLCCSNVYCSCCISKWLKYVNVCPTCRSPKKIEDVHIISSGPVPVNCVGEGNTKLLNFLNLLNTAQKLIVYSNDESMFNNIIPYLVLSNVSYSYLKGTASRYECVLNQFRLSDEKSVILLDNSFYACGLNLQNATDIVFFNKFDNEMEKKIIGSAQRIGRKTELRVWYFITT